VEQEATQSGADIQQTEAPQGGSDDAALLSAYLEQQEQGDVIDDVESGDPAAQDDAPLQPVDTFTVKVNGVERQVTRDELIATYQKGDASNKRFEEAAQIRRDAESQMANFQQHQQVLANAIQHFNQAAERYSIAPPSLNLLDSNPVEYLRQKELYESHQGELHRVQVAQAYLQQQQQAEQQQYMHKHLESEGIKLLDLIPEWNDRAVRTREEQDLISFLSEKGYTREDIAGLDKSRAANVLLAVNAMKYERLQKQAKSANKRVESLPPRVERPGVSNVQSGKREAYQRLTRSGSIDDAAAALYDLFS